MDAEKVNLVQETAGIFDVYDTIAIHVAVKLSLAELRCPASIIAPLDTRWLRVKMQGCQRLRSLGGNAACVPGNVTGTWRLPRAPSEADS